MSKDTHKYRNVDFTGQRFGRLTVIRKADHGYSWWVCKCACGREKEIIACRLFTVQSCGCLEKENLEKIGQHNKTHGMADSRLYSVWCGIKDRCFNQNIEHYDRYGGRGITMCDDWRNSFEAFRDWAFSAGYDPALSGKEQSIDRIDVNGNYEPSNCRWVSQKQQMRNIGRTVYMEYNGKTVPVVEFCEMYGITYSHFVRRRLAKGESPDEIIKSWNLKHNRPDNMLTIQEAAKYYNICEQSIYDWIYKGWLKAEKSGQSWFIPKGQVVTRRGDRNEKGQFLPGISRPQGKVAL